MSRSHDSFGVGAGEGLAAVRGHQSGGEGTWAAMPSSSLGDQSNLGSYDSASRHQLRFYLGHAGRVPLPMRRSRGDRPTRDSARSASAPYQLEV